MTASFPITVRMPAAALQELHSCEYGSYEDNIGDERQDEYADGTLHIVEIIERSPFKTVIRLENQAEVDEFFAMAMSGTFSLAHPGICLRIYRELLPLVSDAVPEWIRKRPGIGY